MTTAVREGIAVLSLAGAAIFALSLIASSMVVNSDWLSRRRAADRGDQLAAAHSADNADLIAVAYSWGGLALLSIYSLSGLYWQHGWQYGIGMALISVLLSGYAWLLRSGTGAVASHTALRLAAWLTLAQSIAAAGGLVFLLASGKVGSAKSDWPANQVFLAGGLAIVALSVIALLARRRIAADNASPSGIAPVQRAPTSR